MNVVITRTTPLYPSAIFIQWDITGTTETGIYIVDVERAGSPNGPWETLTSGAKSIYHYLDDLLQNKPIAVPGELKEGANLLSLQREIYYRITVTPPSGRDNSVSTISPVEPTLDKRMKLIKRKILFDEAKGLDKVNGIDLAILKRKHWGTRCPDCFDPVTKEVLQEHCNTCYGTSFVGGYWDPVIIKGRIGASPAQTQISPHGKVEVNTTRITVLDYPKLEVDDIIVSIRDNDRYIVKMITPTTLKKVVVHQVAEISLLSRDSVEYEVKVDPNTSPSLY